jgi:hypothetical protein
MWLNIYLIQERQLTHTTFLNPYNLSYINFPWIFCHDLVNSYILSVSQMTTDIPCLSQYGPYFLLLGLSFGILRSVIWRVTQERLNLPEHMSSLRDFSGLGVGQSLIFCVVFFWNTVFLHVLVPLVVILSVIYGFVLHVGISKLFVSYTHLFSC